MNVIQNPMLQLIEERSTLRRYADRPVEPEVEQAIIRAALRAPTASNMMYYSIITIHDKELQKKLQEICNQQPYISQAPCMLIFCADYQRIYDWFEKDQVPEKCAQLGKEYLYPSEKNFLLGVDDAMLAAENAILAAESLGLGSCLIGHIVNHRREHQRLLGLPDLVFPIVALLIGYPQEGQPRKKSARFDQRFIVHENRYHRLSGEELDEMFGSRFGYTPKNRFQAENAGQQLYLSKYAASACYSQEVQSIREALRVWCFTGQEKPEENKGDVQK